MVKNHLQELRVEHGYTRPQMGDLIGVGWETIKAYEVKGVVPSLEKALKIAKVFKKSVDDIFELIEEEETA